MQVFLQKVKRELLGILIIIAAIAVSIVFTILIMFLMAKIQTSLIHKGDFIILGGGLTFFLIFIFLSDFYISF